MSRDNGGGIATGVVLVLLGLFLLLRTVRRPAGGRTLVDVLLGDTPAPAGNG